MKPANNEALAILSNFSEYLFNKYQLHGPLYNIVSPGNQVTASQDHTELHFFFTLGKDQNPKL